ncbi:putative RDD family membrane protein YckC [Alkalibacillus filiformis]|uniref:RDD family membrane protein YckC n=1 Tax=Alkalibacillus filiformis TaxID=200990 RepID=A0ABU0DUA6_9BACI|nr:RDD family protein [Alkalibacillus filiformis]MDQ0352041.1 putative RDD family membrane protein YckC [Alkalibacillus filiformis]
MQQLDSPAGFWIRLIALLVDGIVLMITVGIMTSIVYGQFFMERETIFEFIEPIYFVILPILWTGYTLGKRAMGIRIAKIDGTKLGLGAMLLREIVGGLIYVLTFGIGVIVSIFMVVFREDKRSIHDLIAKTYVTYNEPYELNQYN